MADWGQIIAGIDGYRNYENNRALDLQNQAQLIQNQANDIRKKEMMTINDIKGQIAALSDNPYAKLNAWDPQARGQQLLNEDKQLKIASKWASSIKNLAPEKRAQGYAQFLRAMPGLGIDVSDMPQAYDEAYINQLADLGIETETRYQNEQQNARQDKQIAATQANLERQIAANREARQDEFNKKLAAFDYENSYRTQAEKDKQAQIDSMIDASTLSQEDKERAKLAYRNITLPGVKTPQERLMEQFTNPDATDEQRAAARQGLMRIAELQKEIKDLTPVNVSAKDTGAIINNLSTAVQKGTMEPQVASAITKQLTGNDVDFVAPPKTYTAGDVGTMQFLMDNGYSADGARQAVGKATPEERLQFEQQKSDINAENQMRVNDASAQNNLNNQVIMAGINADNAEQQAQRDFVRNQQLIDYKNSLPTPEQKNISAAAKALGIPEEQLYQMSLNKQQAEIDLDKKRSDLINAQIGQTLANTAKINEESGTTPQIRNYEYVKANPQAATSPLFQGGAPTVTVNTGDTATENNGGLKLTGNKKYDEAYSAEYGKATAKAEQARKDAEKMKPTVLKAIERAKDAAIDGTGIGIVGGRVAGWGLTPSKKAGQNYADIQSANTQMNTYLRKELAGAGLTGTELNSAVEAQAYRYTIAPEDNETVILRKLENFVADHIDNQQDDPLGIL